MPPAENPTHTYIPLCIHTEVSKQYTPTDCLLISFYSATYTLPAPTHSTLPRVVYLANSCCCCCYTSGSGPSNTTTRAATSEHQATLGKIHFMLKSASLFKL
jgi:hypothetical protein